MFDDEPLDHPDGSPMMLIFDEKSIHAERNVTESQSQSSETEEQALPTKKSAKKLCIKIREILFIIIKMMFMIKIIIRMIILMSLLKLYNKMLLSLKYEERHEIEQSEHLDLADYYNTLFNGYKTIIDDIMMLLVLILHDILFNNKYKEKHETEHVDLANSGEIFDEQENKEEQATLDETKFSNWVHVDLTNSGEIFDEQENKGGQATLDETKFSNSKTESLLSRRSSSSDKLDFVIVSLSDAEDFAN